VGDARLATCEAGARGDVTSGTRGRKIRDVGFIAEKRKKVVVNRSKKLIWKKRRKHRLFFLSIHIDLLITENTYLHAFC